MTAAKAVFALVLEGRLIVTFANYYVRPSYWEKKPGALVKLHDLALPLNHSRTFTGRD